MSFHVFNCHFCNNGVLMLRFRPVKALHLLTSIKTAETWAEPWLREERPFRSARTGEFLKHVRAVRVRPKRGGGFVAKVVGGEADPRVAELSVSEVENEMKEYVII